MGRLIGVCNAADYEGDVGIYAGPGSVRWQLDKAGLSAIYLRAKDPEIRLAARDGGRPAADSPSPMGTREGFANGDIQRATTTSVATATGATSADQEVIVIVRDRTNPAVPAKVMTLNDPSADLMHMIQQHAEN